MAAVFPDLAACQDNAPAGPTEIPDHLLVRETMGDCLERGDGHRRPEGACGPVRAGRRPAPLPRHRRAQRARPRDPERRSRSPSSTRTPRSASAGRARSRCAAACRWSHESSAGSTPTRSRGCGPRRRRTCAGRTSSTTCSCRWSRCGRERSGASISRPSRARAGPSRCTARPASCGRPPSAGRRSKPSSPARGSSPTTRFRAGLAPVVDAAAADEAKVMLVRGHLDVSGPRHAWTTSRLPRAWRRPRSALPSRPCADAGSRSRASSSPSGASSGAPAGCWPGSTATRASGRRAAVRPISQEEWQEFLQSWWHAAPGTKRHGRAGLAEVIEQLQGFEWPAGEWERLLRRARGVLPARVARRSVPLGRGGVGPAVRWSSPPPRTTIPPPASRAARARRRPAGRRSRSCSVRTCPGSSRPTAGPRCPPNRPPARAGRCSTACAGRAPCSTPSSRRSPGACPPRSRKDCGTASPAG